MHFLPMNMARPDGDISADAIAEAVGMISGKFLNMTRPTRNPLVTRHIWREGV
jgi:hypothetical protein